MPRLMFVAALGVCTLIAPVLAAEMLLARASSR